MFPEEANLLSFIPRSLIGSNLNVLEKFTMDLNNQAKDKQSVDQTKYLNKNGKDLLAKLTDFISASDVFNFMEAN